MANNAETAILTFPSLERAKTFRRENGSGGWVFDIEGCSGAILFPNFFDGTLYNWCPSEIMTHPMTRNLNGRVL